MQKFAIFGLDSFSPSLIETFPDFFPFLSTLLKSDKIQNIQSCHPPITIPAWQVVFSGRDPGELGIYGFHSNRNGYTYDQYLSASSLSIKYKMLWENPHFKSPFIMGIPLTYPFPSKQNPHLKGISGILSPSFQINSFSDKGLFNEAGIKPSEYLYDIKDYRNRPESDILMELETMLSQKIRIIDTHLFKDHDLFISVFIGPDRLHHRFLHHFLPSHPHYSYNKNTYEFVQKYYSLLDQSIHRWFEHCDSNNIIPIIISDHGIRPLKGTFNLQKALIEHNFCCLQPDGSIDWTKTKAWAKPGYIGKIYFNLKGREPFGIVSNKQELSNNLDRLFTSLAKQKGVRSKCVAPNTCFKRCSGFPPDLFVYIGDLDYRCWPTPESPTYFSEHTQSILKDAANHDFQGIIGSSIKHRLPSNIQQFYNWLLEFCIK